MNYRKVTVHPLETLSAAGTKTIDIKGLEPISRLTIKFTITKSDHNMHAHGSADVTKIELVDGSDVLFSMTGAEAQALNIYDRKCGSMCHGQHSTANAELTLYGIDFGRFLFDPLLALDPKRFKNLQLKISYTLTTADTGATAGSIEVFSDVFDQKVVTPVGFLMSKEFYSYTCGADGSFEYIDLPVDYTLRKLLVRGYADGKEPWYQLESIRIDEENVKRIPLDIGLETYYRLMKGIWTPVVEPFSIINTAGSQIYYVTPTDYYASIAGIGSGTNRLYHSGPWLPGGKVTTVCAGNDWFAGYAHGYLPNHCFEFPFGDQNDPADWYDLTKLQSIRLRLEAGSNGANGTGQVVLQQFRKY